MLTGDRAQGDDSKQCAYSACFFQVTKLRDITENNIGIDRLPVTEIRNINRCHLNPIMYTITNQFIK